MEPKPKKICNFCGNQKEDSSFQQRKKPDGTIVVNQPCQRCRGAQNLARRVRGKTDDTFAMDISTRIHNHIKNETGGWTKEDY